MSVASLVLGILSIILCLFPGVGFVISLVALIISILAMCVKKDKEKNKGLKIAGLVTSIIGFIISSLIMVLMIGAIILSINSEQVIQNAEQAVLETDLSALRSGLTLQYVEILTTNTDEDPSNDVDVYYAEQVYLNFLQTEHSQLYSRGYRVQVNEDLSFRVVEP